MSSVACEGGMCICGIRYKRAICEAGQPSGARETRFQYTCNLHASVEHSCELRQAWRHASCARSLVRGLQAHCNQPVAPDVAAATHICSGQCAEALVFKTRINLRVLRAVLGGFRSGCSGTEVRTSLIIWQRCSGLHRMDLSACVPVRVRADGGWG